MQIKCPGCMREVVITDLDGRELSGMQQAIVAQAGMSFERRLALTCRYCGTHWLGEVPAAALPRELRR